MAIDMFIKITSAEGPVDGESKDSTHENEIQIQSWTWGMSQAGSTHAGSGGGSGKVSVQDLSFTKKVDRATPTLLKLCCKGSHIPEALLTIRKAGDNPVEYVKLKLVECIISSISTGASGGGDEVHETIGLNFAEFHFEYTLQEDNQAAGASIPMAWNIAKNIEPK